MLTNLLLIPPAVKSRNCVLTVSICSMLTPLRKYISERWTLREAHTELKSVIASSDLVPGVYEGGYKVWEGSIDLVRFLASTSSSEWGISINTSSRVLEVWCGSIPANFAHVGIGRMWARPPRNIRSPTWRRCWFSRLCVFSVLYLFGSPVQRMMMYYGKPLFQMQYWTLILILFEPVLVLLQETGSQPSRYAKKSNGCCKNMCK